MSQQQDLFGPTLSAGDSPARIYRWLDDALDWLASEADCSLSSRESLACLPPAQLLSKTSPAFCRLMKGETWELSSDRWDNSGMGSPTAFLTLNTSEWPSDGGVCSLLDVLETGDVPPKYFLSAKACRGILRRAAKRGRELPPALHAALTAVAKVDTPDDEGRTA